MCEKGDPSTTTRQTSTLKQVGTQSPSPEVLPYYENYLANATRLATTPFNEGTLAQQYPLTPMQGAGLSQVYNLGLDAGNFDPAKVQSIMSPYTQNVVGSTQNWFNNQNAIQGSNLIGQAIKSGNAFGGDRAGVAEAQLAGQQQLAQAPVIAGLYEKGYTQALDEYNRLKQFGMVGAQQAMDAGTFLQQQGQRGLDISQQNQMMKTAYPFQQANWYGSILGGIGPLMGSVSTQDSAGTLEGSTTPPTPSTLVKALGLASSVIGVGKELFPKAAARGGLVRGYDSGGYLGYGDDSDWETYSRFGNEPSYDYEYGQEYGEAKSKYGDEEDKKEKKNIPEETALGDKTKIVLGSGEEKELPNIYGRMPTPRVLQKGEKKGDGESKGQQPGYAPTGGATASSSGGIGSSLGRIGGSIAGGFLGSFAGPFGTAAGAGVGGWLGEKVGSLLGFEEGGLVHLANGGDGTWDYERGEGPDPRGPYDMRYELEQGYVAPDADRAMARQIMANQYEQASDRYPDISSFGFTSGPLDEYRSRFTPTVAPWEPGGATEDEPDYTRKMRLPFRLPYIPRKEEQEDPEAQAYQRDIKPPDDDEYPEDPTRKEPEVPPWEAPDEDEDSTTRIIAPQAGLVPHGQGTFGPARMGLTNLPPNYVGPGERIPGAGVPGSGPGRSSSRASAHPAAVGSQDNLETRLAKSPWIRAGIAMLTGNATDTLTGIGHGLQGFVGSAKAGELDKKGKIVQGGDGNYHVIHGDGKSINTGVPIKGGVGGTGGGGVDTKSARNPDGTPNENSAAGRALIARGDKFWQSGVKQEETIRKEGVKETASEKRAAEALVKQQIQIDATNERAKEMRAAGFEKQAISLEASASRQQKALDAKKESAGTGKWKGTGSFLGGQEIFYNDKTMERRINDPATNQMVPLPGAGVAPAATPAPAPAVTSTPAPAVAPAPVVPQPTEVTADPLMLPQEPAATAVQSPAPAPVEPSPTAKLVGPWAPVTTVLPPGTRTPPQRTLTRGAETAQFKNNLTLQAKLAERAELAGAQIGRMTELESALSQLPSEGPLSPGAFAPVVKGVVENLNHIALIVGIQDPVKGGVWQYQPDVIAAMQSAEKIKTLGGFLQSRLTGGGQHNAAVIIQASMRAYPGYEQTKKGAAWIIASNKEIAQRERDMEAFVNAHVGPDPGQYSRVQQAVAAFNEFNPAERYIQRAKKNVEAVYGEIIFRPTLESDYKALMPGSLWVDSAGNERRKP